MNLPIYVCIALLLVGCNCAPSLQRQVVIMHPHDGDILWSFHESKDELGSGGELQIFIDPQTQPEATASFAKYTLGVGGALPVTPARKDGGVRIHPLRRRSGYCAK